MNRKFLSAILFGALMVSSTGTFVSCKDYDDDIDEINNKISGIESQIAALESKIKDGKWVTNVTPSSEGLTITMSDGQTYKITNGKNGTDGAVGAAGTEWTISEDGFWVCNGDKTNVKAVGQNGEKGDPGQQEVKKENGKWYLWNAETGAFEEIAVNASASANVPYYYEDPSDPNYTYLVIYDENGQNEKKVRLPMTSGLAQVIVVGEELNIVWNTFNGAHFKDGKATEWKGAKTLPSKGEYMLTANTNAIYVQVVPSNYDISNLEFKLVNSKGDEAPIKLGTPEPCKEAIEARANVSESGVYAISYTLPEMTDAIIKAYKSDIEGKALSLVASESVRSTYGYELSLKQTTASDNLTFGSVSTKLETTDQPYTVKMDQNADKVYDSFLTMADAAGKADSVRYGISIDGMTVSYTGEMPANKTVKFTINQINARAVVDSRKSVEVTFNAQDVTVKNIMLDALAPHKAVALKKDASGKTIQNQYVDVDLAPYFAQIAPEEGDRLMWNEDTKKINMNDIKVEWTEIDGQGNMKEPVVVSNLVNSITFLTTDGADKVNNTAVTMKDLGKLRLNFKANYGSDIKLGNGSFVATITVKDKATEATLQTIEVPFTIEAPSAEEIATWFNWNAKNSYTADGLVCYVGNGTQTINLTDHFASSSSLVSPVTLVRTVYESTVNNVRVWKPNMTIGYPATVTAGLTTDAQKNQAKNIVTWTNFTNPYWANDPGTNANEYGQYAQISLKTLTSKYFGTYTISGVKVKLGSHELNAANLKLVVKGEASRADVINFSKALQIASKQNEYIRLSDAAFTPNESSFFGTFTLKDYMDRNYVLTNNTTIKVVEVAADGSYDNTFTQVSDNIVANIITYTYTKGSSTSENAYGIQLSYKGTDEYPAGKTFKVMLQISTLYKDGNQFNNSVVVPATITVGGI